MDEPIRARGPGEPPSNDDHEALAGYLDELERLCDAATPGPWSDANWEISGPDREVIFDIPDVAADVAQADAAFVAAARHALPKLIAKVRELQAELDRIDKRLRWETTRDDSERRELERELFGGEDD